MRNKLWKFLPLLALLATLTGCAAKPEDAILEITEVSTITTDAAEEPASLPFDFSMLMRSSEPFESNPIDAAFEADSRRSGSTGSMLSSTSDIYDAWHAEMEHAYQQLLGILNSNEKTNLARAQAAWEEYMEAKYAQLTSTFYPLSDYIFHQVYGGPGSADRVIIHSMHTDETRSRALELMEQVYFFTGKVQFQYDKEALHE